MAAFVPNQAVPAQPLVVRREAVPRPPRTAVLREAFQAAVRDPFRVTLFLLIVMTISRVHMQFPALKPLRPGLLITGIAVVIAYARPNLLSTRPLFQTWPARLIGAFALLACVGAPFGISLGNSASAILSDYDKTVIFALLIIVATRSVRDFRGLVWAVVISSAILAWLALFVFRVSHYHGYDRLANLDTYDANDLGLVLLVGLPFTLLAFRMAGPWGKAACGLVIGATAAAIAKSGSRGALVGLTAAGAAMLLLLRDTPVYKRVGIAFATFVALTLFAPAGYWGQMSTLLNPKADYNWDSPNGRRRVAIRGVEYFFNYPVFGLGMANFQKAECTISSNAHEHLAGEPIQCTPPHNAYVQAGAELGTGGIILWLLMIPGGVISLLRLKKSLPRAWLEDDRDHRLLYLAPDYLAIAFVGFTFGSFFLSFAWMDVTYVLPASWAALVIATAEMRGPGAPTTAQVRAARTAGGQATYAGQARRLSAMRRLAGKRRTT